MQKYADEIHLILSRAAKNAFYLTLGYMAFIFFTEQFFLSGEIKLKIQAGSILLFFSYLYTGYVLFFALVFPAVKKINLLFYQSVFSAVYFMLLQFHSRWVLFSGTVMILFVIKLQLNNIFCIDETE